jgi:serine/threonine-protein kinase
MSESPYSVGEQVTPGAPETPKEIHDKLHNGWIAGAIVGGLSFLYACWIALTSDAQMGIKLAGFIDTLLVFALAFGIYRKSRVAAVLMLVWFVVGRIFQVYVSGQFGGVLLLVIFSLFFYQAAHASFAWHRLQKKAVATNA